MKNPATVKISSANNHDVVEALTSNGDPAPTEIERSKLLSYSRITPCRVVLRSTGNPDIEVDFRSAVALDRFLGSLLAKNEDRHEETTSLEAAPTLTRSPRSNARVIDIDPRTNPLVKTFYTRGDYRIISHRIVVSHVVAWGDPSGQDRHNLPSDESANLAVLLDAGMVVLIVFHSAIHRSLFEEELDQKASAL